MRTNDITVLVPPKTAAPTPQQMATRGTVTIPPAGVTDDTVTVILPSYSPDYGWPCRWIRQGNTLPAIGAECLVLWDETGAGTVVQWAGAFVVPAQARVYNTANISVASATVAALTFDSERLDDGDLHSTSSNTSRLTAPSAGIYLMGGAVSFASNATGYRQLFIRLNGATMVEDNIVPAYGGGVATRLTVGTIYQLAATDYIELAVSHNAGVAVNVEAIGNSSPEFWMVRLSP